MYICFTPDDKVTQQKPEIIYPNTLEKPFLLRNGL